MFCSRNSKKVVFVSKTIWYCSLLDQGLKKNAISEKKSTRQSLHFYSHKRLIACKSDKLAVRALITILTKANSIPSKSGKVDGDGQATESRNMFNDCFIIDRYLPRVYFGGMLISESEEVNVTDVSPRHVTLHTLLYGSIGITI